ncbi:MAG: hypothetical protein AAGA54_26335 [Myxococcota bacterium]
MAYLVALVSLGTGCLSAPPPTAPVAPVVAVAPMVDPFAGGSVQPSARPRFEACDLEAPCSEAIVVASAMSYLGKTTAEFDGVSMVQVEHDPELLLEEAFADPVFCALVAEADVEPPDGMLTASEAARVEAAVLASLDAAG